MNYPSINVLNFLLKRLFVVRWKRDVQSRRLVFFLVNNDFSSRGVLRERLPTGTDGVYVSVQRPRGLRGALQTW